MNKYGKIVDGQFTVYVPEIDPETHKPVKRTESEIYALGYRKVFFDSELVPTPEVHEKMDFTKDYFELGEHYIVEKVTWFPKENESEEN